MLKIFLVEDEIVMREGIKNNIHWEEEGFVFAGEASDGELAFPLIQKTKPDIIITDIKMPFMDGLELSKLVKSELPDTKIIILSGYDEFEYAKEAISIGITDYLVKPIAAAKLLEAVKQVGEKILGEREQKEFFERYQREHQENLNIEKQKLFYELIEGKLSVSEIIQRGKEKGINLSAQGYNIILMKVFSKDNEVGRGGDTVVIEELLEGFVKDKTDILMFDQATEGWAFLIKSMNPEDLPGIIEKYVNEFVKIVTDFKDISYFVGIGCNVNRIRELNKSYDDANKAFAYRYLVDANQVIYSEHLNEKNKKVNLDLELGSLDVGKIDRKIVENFLRSGLREEVHHFIDEYFISLGKDNINSLLFRQYIVMDIYFCSISLMEELGYHQEDIVEKCGELRDVASALTSIDSTKKYLYKLIEEALKNRDDASQKKYDRFLSSAREYIYHNFQKEDISLNTVAASVNLSPNHFSTIFSQQMGQTFIEFLTNVRMEKAKELLKCSGMKSSEVGYAVGYKDPHYFSYIFKKTQDCTPKEFRMRGKESI
ncbi:MAG: response regulator [Lachnospiraceae bacterium]|nr:response regulator [Lachnospiraceae bacterium]